MIENQDQLIDIYDIWYEPIVRWSWFKNSMLLLAGFFLVLILYRIYAKYLKKKQVVDCAIVAHKDLEILKNFHIANEQDSKYCYFSLSSIMKNYLSSRYHSLFIQWTDKEIIEYAPRYMSRQDVQLLTQILQGMTFVKFEHEIPSGKKLEKDIDLIQEFIHNTTPVPHTKEA